MSYEVTLEFRTKKVLTVEANSWDEAEARAREIREAELGFLKGRVSGIEIGIHLIKEI